MKDSYFWIRQHGNGSGKFYANNAGSPIRITKRTYWRAFVSGKGLRLLVGEGTIYTIPSIGNRTVVIQNPTYLLNNWTPVII